jgi:hypothetical protein
MNFKSLSNETLLSKTQTLVREERRITLEILQHLREIERRRAYAEVGFPSLFEYAVKGLGYSEASAFRRISAMRALKEIPDLEQAIVNGRISVTAVSQVQSFLRKDPSIQDVEAKRDLYFQMEGKSSREVERELALISPPAAVPDKVRTLANERTEIRFTVDAATFELFVKARGLLSHQIKDPNSFSELFELMARKLVTQRRAPLPAPKPTETDGEAKRYIPVPVREQVREVAGGRCTYIDPKSGRRCAATEKLQFEHRVPFALGGSSRDPANLTLLCRTHNQLRAIQVFGAAKMNRYLRTS